MSTQASIVNPVSVSNEREIQPMDLPIEQLNNLKAQHEEEIRELQKQMESLAGRMRHIYRMYIYNIEWPLLVSGAKNRFIMAKSSLSDLKEAKNDNQILIPLNSSLYVPGTVNDKNKVMVELGTGYFAEKTIEEATALIDRKVSECCAPAVKL